MAVRPPILRRGDTIGIVSIASPLDPAVINARADTLRSIGFNVLLGFNEVIIPFDKPLMTNLATGHGVYKAAIPIGARVNLNTFSNTLTVIEPTVSSLQLIVQLQGYPRL